MKDPHTTPTGSKMPFDSQEEYERSCEAIGGKPMTPYDPQTKEQCHADRDGECSHINCPQLRDGEPMATGRHCPLDTWGTDDEA